MPLVNISTIWCFLIFCPNFTICSYQFRLCPTCNREYYRLHCFPLMRPLLSMKLGAERTVLNANEWRREFPFNMSYEALGINRWWWVVGVTASCIWMRRSLVCQLSSLLYAWNLVIPISSPTFSQQFVLWLPRAN